MSQRISESVTPTLLAAASLTLLLSLSACSSTASAPTDSTAPTVVAPADPTQPTQDMTENENLPEVLTDPKTGQPYFSRQVAVQLGGKSAEALAQALGARVADQLPVLGVAVLEFDSVRDTVQGRRTLLEGGQVQQVFWHYVVNKTPEVPLEDAFQPQNLTAQNLMALGNPAGQVFDALPQYALDSDHMHAQAAWDAGLTGAGITVGVIDDPVDVTHPDLAANWGGLAYDPLADKSYHTAEGWLDALDRMGRVPMPLDGALDESFSHGTAVTSTISAALDGQGMVGVAPDAKYLPAAMFQPGSVGSVGVARAILWQVDNGAKVLNNSWGGAGYDPLIKLALDYALERNVTVVVSAGNESRELYQRPALYSGVIPSAALDANNEKASFSTFGRHISVGAPGVDVLMASPVWMNDDGTRRTGATPMDGSGYTLMSGTSFSGPYTAGAAALVLGAQPDLDPYQVRRLLEETADGSVGSNPNGFDRGTGHGLIRLDNLAERLQQGDLPQKGGALRVRVAVPKPDGTYVPLTMGADIIIEQQLADREDGPIYGVQTNSDGEAVFLALAPGQYTLRVGGPDNDASGNGNGGRGTYVGNVTVESGTTKADVETTLVQLDKGYVDTSPVDPYEPNDTIATATPLTFDQTTELAYIYNPDAEYDVDYFKFEGEEGKYINLDVLDKYEGDVGGTLWGYAVLRDSDGKVVNSYNRPVAGSSLFAKLPASGTYYVQVGSYFHLQPSVGEDLSKGQFSNEYTNRYKLLLTTF